ncbi:CHAT domain-containing protein [Nocardia salmonicida]|uniref:CHAT domain-containing protein n=1 Tax=Nocardia salmonicida TaxID=53431 RepID=UPI0007A4CB77|nr:CHAT domain-containing protein [Nocardia salmonicida]
MANLFDRASSKRQSSSERVESADEQTVVALRSAARVFDILERSPIFRQDIAYAREVLSGLVEHEGVGLLDKAVLGTVSAKIAEAYVSVGHHDSAAAVRSDFAILGDAYTATNLKVLSDSIDSIHVQEADTAVVSAVISAILAQIDALAPTVTPSEHLHAAIAAAYSNGLIPLMGRGLAVAENFTHSLGFGALFTFYRSQMPFTRRDHATYRQLRARYLAEFARVQRSDPAARHVERLASWAQRHDASDSANGGDPTLLGQAARAADAGDHHSVARLYAQLVNEAETPDQAGAFCLVSELSMMRSGQLASPAEFRLSMGRLANNHLTKAKALVPVDELLIDYCGQARRVDRTHPGSDLAAQVADFAGDVRLGVALDHRYSNLSTGTRALVDLAAVDALQRDPEVLEIADLKNSLPGASVVWITLSHDDPQSPDDTSYRRYLHVTTLSSESTTCHVDEIVLSDQQVRLIENAMGVLSEDVSDDALEWLANRLFEHLSPDNVGAGVYVIPDQPSWELPWSRLLPTFVRQFCVAPSIAAVMRLTPTIPRERPRILGMFNHEMRGSQRELNILRRLHADELIDFRHAAAFADLATALRSDAYDLLAIGAHGSRSEGFEFEIDFGTEQVPLAELLTLPLPPAISLGCCWSAKSTESTHSVVASLACILGGASLVAGGLWDLDDHASSAILCAAYVAFAAGHPLPAAFRQAFLDQPPTDRQPGAGVCLFGRW